LNRRVWTLIFGANVALHAVCFAMESGEIIGWDPTDQENDRFAFSRI
jgi:hypothetical protein